ELAGFYHKRRPFYSGSDQLVFGHETSKDARDAIRKYAWPRRNTPTIVSLSISRGDQLSVLAAFDVGGFFSWESTTGTFDRHAFHEAFRTKIAPYLNSGPIPRSIVILDNAKIHMYPELEELVHSRGSILLFLPPYSPQLNPIEVGFSLLKGWITRHASLAFHQDPNRTLDVALKNVHQKT
ncbi:hypothetical protein JG688_00011595, partial [Phytophthora aleatoria]